MRTLIAIAALLFLFAETGFATVLTVSNHPAGGAQYSSLTAAYNASSDGDTILVEGTDMPYDMNTCGSWWKSLTVIGIGFNPNKQVAKRTKFRSTLCHGSDPFRIGTAGGGSRFYGIEFLYIVWVNETSDDLLFADCKFNNNITFSFGASNLVLTNCIFDIDNDVNINFAGTGYSVNALISNCLFDGYIEGNGGLFYTAAIEHCMFLSTTTNPFSNLHYALIRDNIFMNVFPDGTFNSDFQNNLAAVPGTFPPSPANGNTASGNVENTDPLLLTYTSGTTYSPGYDFDLQAGSAAIGAATDGTDIGIHGGSSSFSETGEVLIVPIMRELNILNSSVAPNGTLNVQVHASKPSTN